LAIFLSFWCSFTKEELCVCLWLQFVFFCVLLFCSNCQLSILLERKVARVVLCYKRRRKRLLDGRGVYLVHFFCVALWERRLLLA
jgi:hypothetical protein